MGIAAHAHARQLHHLVGALQRSLEVGGHGIQDSGDKPAGGLLGSARPFYSPAGCQKSSNFAKHVFLCAANPAGRSRRAWDCGRAADEIRTVIADIDDLVDQLQAGCQTFLDEEASASEWMGVTFTAHLHGRFDGAAGR